MENGVNQAVLEQKENELKNKTSIEPLHNTPDAEWSSTWPTHNQASNSEEHQDHFIKRNGLEFAGTHLIFDFWGASQLDNLELMESSLKECVTQCGATLLHIHLHHFSPNGGISGVAVLAESHISVHTWPEKGYAAFDVFMCGDAKPEKSIEVLQKSFNPSSCNVTEHLRGLVTINNR